MHLSYRDADYAVVPHSYVGLCSADDPLGSALFQPTGSRWGWFYPVAEAIASWSRGALSMVQGVWGQHAALVYPWRTTMSYFSQYEGGAVQSGVLAVQAEPDAGSLYQVERQLQLAYAVGDRKQILALEADLEALTGWRFNRQRPWLDRGAAA